MCIGESPLPVTVSGGVTGNEILVVTASHSNDDLTVEERAIVRQTQTAVLTLLTLLCLCSFRKRMNRCLQK